MSQRAEPVRVLHFTRFINRHDFIDTIIRFADRRRFHMMACTLTDRSTIEDPHYREDGIPHRVLHCDRRPRYPLAVLRLARLLRRLRVDVLHTHHFEESVLGALAAELARTPLVVGRHYHRDLYSVAPAWKGRLLLRAEAFSNHRARLVVVPSRQIRDLLVGQRVPAGKVAVVPYGFDFTADRYGGLDEGEVREVRRELKLDGAFVVGNFGRHHDLKGQDDLLRGFARFLRDVPGARLVMVGDGPQHPALRALAQDLGVARAVTFTGWRQDVGRLMAAVDIVVHPTLQDAFPQVVVEALVRAKPLIVTGAAGPADQVEHLRTGLVIPMRDPEAIHGALRWLFEHPEEARRLGERGRRHVLEELDIRKVIRRYEACYDTVLAPAARRDGSSIPVRRSITR